MKRFFHIVRRILLLAAGLVLLAVGGAVIFANTDYARDRLREEARVAILEQFGLEATFEDAEVEAIPPRGHVLGVEIAGSDGEPLLTVERLTVGLGAAALLAGEVEITEVSIEEPRLRLVVEDRRIVNLPEIRSQQGEQEGEAEIPSDVGVLAGQVTVEWRDAPGGALTAELEDTNLDINTDRATGDTEVRLLVAGGTIVQGTEELPIELLQGRVMVQPEEGLARVRHVRVRLGDVRAQLQSATVGLEAPYDLDGAVELWAPLDLVNALPLPAPLLEGDLHVEADVSRQGGRIEAQGQVEIDDLIVGPEQIGPNVQTWGPHPIGDVRATVAYTPERVAVSELTVDRPMEDDGRIVVRDITLALDDPELTIDGQLTLERIQLAYVLIDAGLYASRVRATVDGTATLHGTFRDFRLRFRPLNFRVSDFVVYTASITKWDAEPILSIANASLRGKVVINDHEVQLRGMTVAFGSTQLSVLAELGTVGEDKGLDIRAQSVDGRFDLSDVGAIAGLDFGGTGSIRARIAGPYPDPSLEGQASLSDFRINEVQFGDVAGPVAWQRDTITLPAMTGSRNDSHYRFDDGRIVIGGGGATLDGVARLEPMHVRDAVEMFGVEMAAAHRTQGAVTGEAIVRYTSRAERWVVDVTGTAEGLAYGDERLGDGELDLTWDEGDVDLRQLVVRDGEGQLSARGRITREGSLDGLRVSVSSYPIQSIESRPEALAGLVGRVRAEAVLDGPVDALRGQGWVELSPVVYGGHRFGPSRLHFGLDAGRVTASGGLAGRMVRLDEATFRMAPPYPLWIRGAVQDLDVGAIVGQGRLPEGMRVVLDATLDAGVELRRQPRLDGTISVSRLLVHHPAFEIRNAETVELSLERQRVAVSTSPFDVTSSTLRQATSFTLGGTVSAQRLDLDVRGALDLGFLSAALDPVEELSGTLTVDCQVGGPLREPRLAGQAEARIERLTLAGLPYTAEDIVGRLRFSRNAVLLEDLSARLLGGRATGSGRVALSGLSLGAYRLDVAMRDASLPVGPRSSAVANAVLSITSPRQEGDLPLVGGRVELVRVRYEEPIYFGADLSGLGRQRIAEVRTFDPEGDTIRFDVQLIGGGNLRIDNNLARATVIIDDSAQPFRLVGTNQTYAFMGRAAVERRGTVTFRDTEFEIERGIVEFDDPYDLNPRLDFVASATRRDWRITLQVGGTRRDPLLLWRSDPPLSEEDIALLLTVGLTREETEQLGYGDAAMSAAPEILSQITGLDRELSRLVPILDEVRITTDYSPRTGRPEPRVRVGRRLTDGIRLGGSVALNEHQDFEANVAVQITDSLSFEGVYESETEYNVGGDFRWRVEF